MELSGNSEKILYRQKKIDVSWIVKYGVGEFIVNVGKIIQIIRKDYTYFTSPKEHCFYDGEWESAVRCN